MLLGRLSFNKIRHMKHFYSFFGILLKKVNLLFFTILFLIGFTPAEANLVVGYTPSCVTTGQTVTIGINSASTFAGCNFHWQYRLTIPGSSPGPWFFLSGVTAGTPVNNTINGIVFPVSNAYVISPSPNYSFSLSIANATTALNDVEFRVLLGPYGDPQVLPSPVWNGDDQAPNEAKTVRIRIRPANETCFSSCFDNILVTSPPSNINTALEEYYGGFETTSANFNGINANGSSITAQTDYTVWTEALGVPGNNTVGIINNPFTMIWQASAFAPHSGRNMLAVHQSDNTTGRIWYKTLVASSLPSQQYFGGQLTLRVWSSKTGPGAAAPCFALELKGVNAANVTSVLNTLPVTMTSTAGQPGFAPGDWVQYTLTYNVPSGIYKSLEASIRGNCTTASNFALDDICLVVPAASVLPVKLSGFTGAYIDGVSKLNWVTELENNTAYFEIQHSIDGVNFNSLGRVNAVGFSSRQQQYNFDDIKAGTGQNYYRLKMVDKDGRFELSNIVSLKVLIKGLIVTRIYPSPFTDNVNISIASENKTEAAIRLMDNTGRVLVNRIYTVNKGVTIININSLAKLAKGYYIAEVKAADAVYIQKVIK
jgi:hypothetical protein